MAYELPVNITTLYDLIAWAESISYHTFTSTFIIAMTLIIFVATLNAFGEDRALTLAAFLGFIASLLFNILGLISGYMVMVYGVLIGVGIIWMRLS